MPGADLSVGSMMPTAKLDDLRELDASVAGDVVHDREVAIVLVQGGNPATDDPDLVALGRPQGGVHRLERVAAGA